ncbi:hypothetical protein NDU88_000443 [Pleurodeles waltl]|uniref:SpoVT-AbrB domain-containing protein n=1 Tax=Pleurodeles waltl TaxID=8319 RepID=A0AAV7L858_PLEWA|nr:hypothetical protein NDU88_000443 [Pleurodeles waltl]
MSSSEPGPEDPGVAHTWQGRRIIIPSALKEQSLSLAHIGHQGIVKPKAVAEATEPVHGLRQMCPARDRQTRHPRTSGH